MTSAGESHFSIFIRRCFGVTRILRGHVYISDTESVLLGWFLIHTANTLRPKVIGLQCNFISFHKCCLICIFHPVAYVVFCFIELLHAESNKCLSFAMSAEVHRKITNKYKNRRKKTISQSVIQNLDAERFLCLAKAYVGPY